MGHVKQVLIETGGSLPAELWQDPVMVAEFSHFGGQYPEHGEPHTCKTHWRAKIENDYVRAVAPVTYDLWRHITTKAGKVLHCPACWHDRIVSFCQDIERVSLHYTNIGALSFIPIALDDRKKTADRIRQRNKRAGEGEPQITYTTFPLDNQIIFLHDGPDYLNGETLPDDRAELFKLVSTWADTPMGKRAGHGIKAWITNGPKTAGEDDQAAEDKAETETKPKPAGDDSSKRIGYITGGDWWLVCRLIGAYLGETPNNKGMRFKAGELHISELIELLEAANVTDYAIEGEVTIGQKGKENQPEAEPMPEPAPLQF